MKSGVFVLAAVFILVLSTGFVNLIAQGSGGSESGDAVLLSKSSDNINLGDTWGVFTGTIDGDDLKVLADGTYVEMNNKKLKEAYGASYFYPFYFSLLIRKLMAQFRKVKLSQQLGRNNVN